MIIISLLMSVAAYVTVLITSGQLAKGAFENTADRLYFQVVRNVLCVIMMFLITRTLKASGLTMILAAVMGLASLVSSFFSLICYRLGPISISVLLINLITLIISSLSGPIIWGEAITLFQILGIVMAMASMALLTEKSVVKKASFMWVVTLILSGISAGVQGPIQKVLTNSAYAGERQEFVLYTFIFSTIASIILLLFVNGAMKEKRSFKFNKGITFLFILQAVLSLFLNINNLKLVGELPTTVFFPAYTVGGLLLSSVISIYLFREKPTVRRIIGLVIGLVSLLFISGVVG
ncbi:MAG: EamA family transporter [Eubacteriales bacterium]|nr:EamA family transporter [Eubacteriales bacterium]